MMTISCHSLQLPGGGPVLPASAVPGSWFNAASPASLGLTAAPQAFSLSVPLAARWRRLRAAVSSRSMVRPHDSHVKVRSASDRLGFRQPQAEQVFELGYQRSATRSVPPPRWAL